MGFCLDHLHCALDRKTNKIMRHRLPSIWFPTGVIGRDLTAHLTEQILSTIHGHLVLIFKPFTYNFSLPKEKKNNQRINQYLQISSTC